MSERWVSFTSNDIELDMARSSDQEENGECSLE
jgi:hypothetical protein